MTSQNRYTIVPVKSRRALDKISCESFSQELYGAAIAEINEDLLIYTSNNMLDDGLVNSSTFISMVSKLEDTFDIELDSSLLEEEYFGNKDRIIKTVKELLE